MSFCCLAMQRKVVVDEVRTPTNTWSGLGFSKSMPGSAIKELVRTVTYVLKGEHSVVRIKERLLSACVVGYCRFCCPEL